MRVWEREFESSTYLLILLNPFHRRTVEVLVLRFIAYLEFRGYLVKYLTHCGS